MKKIGLLILFFALCLLSGCKTDAERLAQLKQQAEQQTALVVSVIERGEMDSVLLLTDGDGTIMYALFDPQRMVYWSHNSLIMRNLPSVQYNGWETFDFDNATAEVMWTDMGWYRLLTIIPTEWHIKGLDEIERSFSYIHLKDKESSGLLWQTSRARVRVYFIILVALIVLLFGMALWALVSARGFRNLRLRQKIQLLLSALVVFSFGYVVASVIRFERKHYEEQQKAALQAKCYFAQESLRYLYYWDLGLSSFNSEGLNVDLRDLAYTYGADIHVYDLNGFLVGSSTPELFEHGLLNRYMDPYVYFTPDNTMVRYEHIGNVQYLAAFTDFVNGSNVPIGYIAMPSFLSEEDMAREVDGFLARLLPPYIIVLMLALVLSYLAARVITQPIQRLIEKMKHFALGKDNYIAYEYQDELGELVNRYNLMVSELEQTTKRLVRSEREGAWRTMARQVAHEINNPLTSIKLTLQQLQRTREMPDFDERFKKASTILLEQIDNLSRIATSFLSFAKLPQVVVSEVDVAEKLSQAVGLFQNNPMNVPIRYVGPDSGVVACADKEQIGQVFTNIIKNALQALEGRDDGDIIVILKDLDDTVEITFSDNGPGIPADIQSKIFMPNFTTKSMGTGLGLAISKNIVDGSDGKISFTTSEKGTIFLVCLQKKV